MIVITTYGRRKTPSNNDRDFASSKERAEAFATMFAYAGRYTLEGDTVTHHVEAHSTQNWVGTDFVRQVTLEGNRLTIRAPRGRKLTWERLI